MDIHISISGGGDARTYHVSISGWNNGETNGRTGVNVYSPRHFVALK